MWARGGHDGGFSLSGAAVTNDHRPEARRLKSRCRQPRSLHGCKGAFHPSTFQLLLALGFPWLVAASPHSLLRLHTAFFPLSVSSPLLSLPRMLDIGFRAYLDNPECSHLKILNYICKDHSPRKGHMHRFWGALGSRPLPALFGPLSVLCHVARPTWGNSRNVCVSPGPSRPTSLHSVHRSARYCSGPGKEKADFWTKLYTSKEAKNLPAARVGSAARRDADHPGNRGHHLLGALLLPPAWREQRR